jgi:hypothetical protein
LKPTVKDSLDQPTVKDSLDHSVSTRIRRSPSVSFDPTCGSVCRRRPVAPSMKPVHWRPVSSSVSTQSSSPQSSSWANAALTIVSHHRPSRPPGRMQR